jgi:hypothetical protein
MVSFPIWKAMSYFLLIATILQNLNENSAFYIHDIMRHLLEQVLRGLLGLT